MRQRAVARPVAPRPLAVVAPMPLDEQWSRLTDIVTTARQRYDRAEAAEATARTKLAAIAYQISALREELEAIRDLHPAIAPVRLPVVDRVRGPNRPTVAATPIAA